MRDMRWKATPSFDLLSTNKMLSTSENVQKEIAIVHNASATSKPTIPQKTTYQVQIEIGAASGTVQISMRDRRWKTTPLIWHTANQQNDKHI